MRISIAWWNTSLSPLGTARATEREKAYAVAVVRALAAEVEVDFLALGEVTTEDLKDFRRDEALRDYDLFDGTLKTGRLHFDTGLLFRRTKFRVLQSMSIVTSRGRRKLKVANRIDMLTPYSEYPLHIFISHWPSRLWCQQNDADRHVLGVRLRDAVDELNRFYRRPANTILLGDYNDEPFDTSLSEHLLAARDRRLVRKNGDLLYNPFWRHLGERDPHVPGELHVGVCGTYNYSSGRGTQWHTFDQIIFSSAFLGTSEWHLDERQTQILPLSPFESHDGTGSGKFDHLPVMSVIQRRHQDD